MRDELAGVLLVDTITVTRYCVELTEQGATCDRNRPLLLGRLQDSPAADFFNGHRAEAAAKMYTKCGINLTLPVLVRVDFKLQMPRLRGNLASEIHCAILVPTSDDGH